MHRSRQIIIGCSAFLLGILLAAYFGFASTWVWLLSAALMLLSLLQVRSKLGYIAIFACFLLFGIWRYEYYIQNSLVSYAEHFEKKIVVQGRVQGEPTWDKYRNYVLYLDEVSIEGKSYTGLVRIKAVSGQAKEGQIIAATGKLKPGLGKAEGLVSYATVEIIRPSQPLLVRIKNQFMHGLSVSFSKEPAAFVAGILIGSRSGLSPELQESITVSGLSHMVAVSGYNLTIIVGFMQTRLGKKWRWGGLVAALWLIAGFVVLAGMGSSILRAGLMSASFLIMSYYGKRFALLSCLCLVAASMVMVSPSSLLSDMSWQLSFLSLLGIVVLAPRIARLLPARPGWLVDLLAVTLAAQFATMGFVAYNFGTISIIAPLANVIIMPLIPFLMAAGALLALVGLLVPEIASVVAWPFEWLILQIFSLVTYFAKLPLSHINNVSLSMGFVLAYYALLICFVLVAKTTKAEDFTENTKSDTLVPNLKEKSA